MSEAADSNKDWSLLDLLIKGLEARYAMPVEERIYCVMDEITSDARTIYRTRVVSYEVWMAHNGPKNTL